MSSDFEFNAPQYINFSNLDDSGADSFFDTNAQHELDTKTLTISMPIRQEEEKLKSLKNNQNESENKGSQPVGKGGSTPKQKNGNSVLRKVLHEIVNQQIHTDSSTALRKEGQREKSENELLQKLQRLEINDSKAAKLKTPYPSSNAPGGGESLNKSSRKSHHMITRLDALTNKSENQCSSVPSSTSSIGQKAQKLPGTGRQLFKGIKRNASPIHCARKFISLAEQVEHFQKDTPERFRSKPNKSKEPPRSTWAIKTQACIPKTPKLIAKYRQRKIDFPDEKQREEMELEEMKKHQVKAYPLNEKILMGPTLNLRVPIIKKPATIPQPFSLTEPKKKEPHQEPVFQFKAQPLPVSILQGPVGVPPKKSVAPTMPMTPQIRIPVRLRVEVKTPDRTPSHDGLNPPRNTKIEPFSFDSRMRETLQRKQEFINKVIEEEKKTFNSFKAQPMPQYKSFRFDGKHEKTPQKTIPQPFNLTQTKPKEKLLSEPDASALKTTPFKARPATVVRQKPFVPKLEKHEFHLTNDFYLNTEKRALERQKFEEKIKQKEEELRLILKLQKEEEEKLEKELALEERKKAEFKAKPMPRYKPFEIHGGDPEKLTLPQSPKFATKLREAKKTMEVVENC